MSSDSETFERGTRIRTEVLGEDHVRRSLAQASDFSRPLQDLITEYCWGAVWGRPGLERKTRSLINIAMLAALNRQHELALHVKGALNNGCTSDEIREVILQAAIYCGVPAGLEANRTAEQVIDDYLGPAEDAAAS